MCTSTLKKTPCAVYSYDLTLETFQFVTVVYSSCATEMVRANCKKDFKRTLYVFQVGNDGQPTTKSREIRNFILEYDFTR